MKTENVTDGNIVALHLQNGLHSGQRFSWLVFTQNRLANPSLEVQSLTSSSPVAKKGRFQLYCILLPHQSLHAQARHCPKASPSKVTLLCLWALQAEVNQEEFVEHFKAWVGFRLQAVPNIKRCYFLCMVSRFYYSVPSNKTWNYDDSFYEWECVCLYIFSKKLIVASFFSPAKWEIRLHYASVSSRKDSCGSGTQVRLEEKSSSNL